MNFEPAEKMMNFEAGIFQILDEKKKEYLQLFCRNTRF